MPRTIPGLHAHMDFPDFVDPDGKFVRRKDGAVVFAFGKKHLDEPLDDVARTDSAYLDWIANKGDFSTEVKSIVRAALEALHRANWCAAKPLLRSQPVEVVDHFSPNLPPPSWVWSWPTSISRIPGAELPILRKCPLIKVIGTSRRRPGCAKRRRKRVVAWRSGSKSGGGSLGNQWGRKRRNEPSADGPTRAKSTKRTQRGGSPDYEIDETNPGKQPEGDENDETNPELGRIGKMNRLYQMGGGGECPSPWGRAERTQGGSSPRCAHRTQVCEGRASGAAPFSGVASVSGGRNNEGGRMSMDDRSADSGSRWPISCWG